MAAKSKGRAKRQPSRSIIGRILLAAGLALISTSSGTTASTIDGKLPDGRYGCEAYLLGQFVNLGTITIKANVYTEPSLLAFQEQAYNYQMNPNGEITWLGPLGGFTSGGNSISLTQATLNGGNDASFDIIMRQSGGAFTAATCTKR